MKFLQVGKDSFVGVDHIQYVHRDELGRLTISGVKVEQEYEAKVIEQLKLMSSVRPRMEVPIPGWKE